MRDGIFRLHYETAGLDATAAVVICNGAMSGADRHYFIVGRCEQRGNRVKGTMRFTRHTERAGFEQLPEEFDITIHGVGGDDFAQVEIRCAAIAAFKGKATFRWLGPHKLR